MLLQIQSGWSFTSSNALQEPKEKKKKNLKESCQPNQGSAQCFSPPQINISTVIPSTVITATAPQYGGGGGCLSGRRDWEMRERRRLVAERVRRIHRQAGRWRTDKRAELRGKKSRELAFLWSKLEWKSLVYWISCSLHLISHTSITSQSEIVNRSNMEEQVGCLLFKACTLVPCELAHPGRREKTRCLRFYTQ